VNGPRDGGIAGASSAIHQRMISRAGETDVLSRARSAFNPSATGEIAAPGAKASRAPVDERVYDSFGRRRSPRP
jgi:hypothetical protein